jgi:predicted AlkP superfamily phosphohydrolase/phosphomutase
MKNRLNKIMETLVKDCGFIKQAQKDKKAYYNATQLQNEIENLEGQLDAGIINQEQFDAAIKVISESLDQLIGEYQSHD